MVGAHTLMIQRVLGTNPQFRPQGQHLPQQIQAQRIDEREDSGEGLRREIVEVGLIFGELRDAGPRSLGRGAHQPEDLLQLVVVGRAGEKGPARVHLGHDAARAPDVDAGVVRAAAEQDVRCAVPQRDHFVTERVDGDAEGAGEAEICQL